MPSRLPWNLHSEKKEEGIVPRRQFNFENEVDTTFRQMDMQEPGEWYVWGDEVNPVMENVDHDTMKQKVDNDQTGTLYGENTKTGEFYEGGE